MTTQDEVEKEIQRLRIERYKDFIKRNRHMWAETRQLRAEAESLKNCANCRNIIWGDGELLCSKNWVGNKMEKCLHWQANHAGRG